MTPSTGGRGESTEEWINGRVPRRIDQHGGEVIVLEAHRGLLQPLEGPPVQVRRAELLRGEPQHLRIRYPIRLEVFLSRRNNAKR